MAALASKVFPWLVALNLVEAVDLSMSLRPPTAF
jgi:hypothetical protein